MYIYVEKVITAWKCIFDVVYHGSLDPLACTLVWHQCVSWVYEFIWLAVNKPKGIVCKPHKFIILSSSIEINMETGHWCKCGTIFGKHVTFDRNCWHKFNCKVCDTIGNSTEKRMRFSNECPKGKCHWDILDRSFKLQVSWYPWDGKKTTWKPNIKAIASTQVSSEKYQHSMRAMVLLLCNPIYLEFFFLCDSKLSQVHSPMNIKG